MRLRPALIFKDEAATEIRRLFVGPFLPNFLLRRGLLLALPADRRGLRFQAVHSDDVGEAYLRAVVADVARRLQHRRRAAARAARRSADAARRAQLPGAGAGRAAARRAELAAAPAADLAGLARHGAERADDVLRAGSRPSWAGSRATAASKRWRSCSEGMREGHGDGTPPLEADSVGARIDDLKTGVGARQWDRDRDEQIVKYLADVHSIEQQALAQFRAAPKIAGDERLCGPSSAPGRDRRPGAARARAPGRARRHALEAEGRGRRRRRLGDGRLRGLPARHARES